MRKPRDIDAELSALAERAKGLKARKVAQFGELVVATKAEGLDPEVLAGALLAAAESADPQAREAWRRRGAAFFQQQARPRSKRARGIEDRAEGGAPPAGGPSAG